MSMVVCLALVLSGCVKTRAFIAAGQTVDFRKYETVTIEMQDDVHTQYSKDGVPLFRGLLRGKLEAMDYKVAEKDSDLILNVKITSFKPGNKAIQEFIGFGAGKSQLTYLATFKTPTGTTIAQLSGGKAYHGMELADPQLFASGDKTQVNMIEKSVSQISYFISTNGKVE